MDKEILAAYKELGKTDEEIAKVPSDWTPEQHFNFLREEARYLDSQANSQQSTPSLEPIPSPVSSPLDSNLTVLAEVPDEPGLFQTALSDALTPPDFNTGRSVNPVVRGIGDFADSTYEAAKDDPVAFAKEAGLTGAEVVGSALGGTLGFTMFGAPGAFLGAGAGGTLTREAIEAMGLREDEPWYDPNKLVSTGVDAASGGIASVGARAVSKVGQGLERFSDDIARAANPELVMSRILNSGETAVAEVSKAQGEAFVQQVKSVLTKLIPETPIDKVKGAFSEIEGKMSHYRSRAGQLVEATRNKAYKTVTEASGGRVPTFSFEQLYKPLQDLAKETATTPDQYKAINKALQQESMLAAKRVLPDTEYAKLNSALKFFARKDVYEHTGTIGLFDGERAALDSLANMKASPTLSKTAKAGFERRAQLLAEKAEEHMDVIEGAREALSNGEMLTLEQVKDVASKYSKTARTWEKSALKTAQFNAEEEVAGLLWKHFDNVFNETVKEVSPELADKLKAANVMYGTYKDVHREVQAQLSLERTRLAARDATSMSRNYATSGDSLNTNISFTNGSPRVNFSKNVGDRTLISTQDRLEGQFAELAKFVKNPPSAPKRLLAQWSGSLGTLMQRADPVKSNVASFFSQATGQMLEGVLTEAAQSFVGEANAESPDAKGQYVAQSLMSAYTEGQNLPPEQQRELLARVMADPDIVSAGVFERPEHQLTSGIYSVVDNRVMDPKERDLVRKRIDQLDISVVEKSKAVTALNKDGTLVELSQKKPVTKPTYNDTREKVELGTLVDNINSAKASRQDKDILKARRASNVLDFRRTGSE